MSRSRIPEDVAVAEMRAGDFEPVVPYPGAKTPWRSRCTRCGKFSTPRLSNVRAGNRCQLCSSRRGGINGSFAEPAVATMRAAGFEPLEPYIGSTKPWRCRRLSDGAELTLRYVNIKPVASPQEPDEAIATMLSIGFDPLEPYPGSHKPWKSLRLADGAECSPRYCDVRPVSSQKNAGVAIAAMREAGYEPIDPYPGNRALWRCQCMVCGSEVTPRYLNVKAGYRCRVCNPPGNPMPSEVAIAAMRAAGFEPLEPYPGSETPWPCRCTTCQRESTPRLVSAKAGHGCRFCNHPGRRTSNENAAGAMRAAGFEPLENYPNAKNPWRCRCMSCGTERRSDFKV